MPQITSLWKTIFSICDVVGSTIDEKLQASEPFNISIVSVDGKTILVSVNGERILGALRAEDLTTEPA